MKDGWIHFRIKPSHQSKISLNLPDDFYYIVSFNWKTKEIRCDCFAYETKKVCKHTKKVKSLIQKFLMNEEQPIIIQEKRIIKCEGCQKEMEVVVLFDDEGNAEFQTMCDDCAYEFFINHERDKFREEISSQNKSWSDLVNRKKMDEKLGSRQYAKLEPSQKILNTFIMTLGQEWLKENINNYEVLENLVDTAVKLAERLVEKLYEGQNEIQGRN